MVETHPDCYLAISGGGIGALKFTRAINSLPLFWNVRHVLAVSSGAVGGACLLCGIQVEDFIQTYERVMMAKYDTEGDLLGAVKPWMEELLPEDAHIRCSGKLTVITTRITASLLPVVHEYHSTFPTRKFLISVLMATCRVPLITCKGVGQRLVERDHVWDFDGVCLPFDIKAFFAHLVKTTDGPPADAAADTEKPPQIPVFVFYVSSSSFTDMLVPEPPTLAFENGMNQKLAEAMHSHLTAHAPMPSSFKRVNVSWIAKM